METFVLLVDGGHGLSAAYSPHSVTQSNLIIPVADLRRLQIFLNFMQFFGKFCKIVCWRPQKSRCPLLRGILDPPLYTERLRLRIRTFLSQWRLQDFRTVTNVSTLRPTSGHEMEFAMEGITNCDEIKVLHSFPCNKERSYLVCWVVLTLVQSFSHWWTNSMKRHIF